LQQVTGNPSTNTWDGGGNADGGGEEEVYDWAEGLDRKSAMN
jgi:hypothetical protein